MDDRFHVLVVDDNATSRMKLSMAARHLGHSVSTADTGVEALQSLTTQPVDLILLDIEMPEMDGFGVLSELRQTSELRDIPVIVISAADDMANIVRAIELGAQDFLPKNFDQILFRARVGACLETKRLNDQRADYLAQIEAEKQKVDALLAATLPMGAIDELKRTNRVKPRRFDQVVVLIADVVNFTGFCDANPPEEAVTRLERLVRGFEDIARERGLEKIKTMGDAFMATAGLLQPMAQPLPFAAESALAMVDAAPDLAGGWQVRVGVHVGPVVAGVIGQQQHLYDLWGDTVNTASRLTGLAVPGSVCVSRAVWDGIDGEGRSLGTVDVKGKGKQEAFRLDKMTSDTVSEI
ncbi:MAG: adenylate/guanylate cyclase domain-containing protein [Pseudomonadota bacterium]